MQIQIKAWLGDWYDIGDNMEKAVDFYRHIFKAAPLRIRRSHFSKHFRGVERETLELLAKKEAQNEL